MLLRREAMPGPSLTETATWLNETTQVLLHGIDAPVSDMESVNT